MTAYGYVGGDPSKVNVSGYTKGDVLAAKMRAMQSMTSQLEPLIQALGEEFFREAMVEESFRAA